MNGEREPAVRPVGQRTDRRFPRARRLAASVVAVVAVGSVTGCAAGPRGSEPDPIRLGVDLALTGAQTGTDAVFDRALALRVEQHNQQRAGTGLPLLELDVRDNRSDPSVTADNLRQWAADPQVVAVVAGSCGQCVVDSAQLLATLELPVVALAAATAVAEPVDERRWVFKIGPDAADGADVLALELAAQQVSTVGLLSAEDAYGQDGARELASALPVHEIGLVASATLPGGGGEQLIREAVGEVAGWRAEPDPFAPLGTPEPAPGPAAIVVWTASPRHAQQAVAMLRELGWQGRLWLDTAAAAGWAIAGEAATVLAGAQLLFPEVLAINDLIATTPDRAARLAWFGDYLARFGGYDAQAGFAADALDVIVAAQGAGDTDRAGLRAGLESLDYPRGLSGHIAFSAGDHRGLRATALVPLVFRGDAWRPLDSVDD